MSNSLKSIKNEKNTLFVLGIWPFIKKYSNCEKKLIPELNA